MLINCTILKIERERNFEWPLFHCLKPAALRPRLRVGAMWLERVPLDKKGFAKPLFSGIITQVTTFRGKDL